MKHFFLALILFFTINLSSQTWNQMNDTLLRGGFVVSAAHNSIFSNDSVIILATQFGMYRSENYGGDWTFSNNGITNNSLGPVAIATFNNNPYVLVDYKDLYYSIDNGLSWSLTALNGIPASSTMDILSSVQGVLYMHTSSSGFYKSFDGNNWVPSDFVLSVGSDSLSWVSAAGHAGLENSASVITPLPDLLSGPPGAPDLMMSPHGKYVYCLDGTSVYSYDLSGSATSWTLASAFPTPIASFTGYPPTYYFTFGATDSALFLSEVNEPSPGNRSTRVYRSTDRGVTWTELINSGMGVPIMLTLKQINSNTIVVNNIIGDILFSFDNGLHWVKRESHFINHYQQNLIVMNNSLLLKQLKNNGHRSVTGIFKSDDNGTTWYNSNTGLQMLSDFEYDSSKYYGNFDYLFKSGNVAFCGRQPSYLARSYDEGNTWDSISLPVFPSGHLSTWYQGDENTFFLLMSKDTLFPDGTTMDYDGIRKYFRTNDAGNTWQVVPSISALDTTIYTYSSAPQQIIGKHDTLLLYQEEMSPIPGVPQIVIFESYDNGTSWTDISGSIFNSLVLSIDNTNGGGYAIPLIDFDSTANRFMAVLTSHDPTNNTTYWTGPTYDSLYLFDISTGWTKINASGLPSGININALKYSNGGWNIGSDQGMFYSMDSGATWLSGVSAFAPWVNENRSLSSDGFYEGVKISTLNIRNTDAFVSTNSNGCWRNSVIPAGINEKELNSSFVIYPNPAVDKINLVSKKDLNKCSLQIFDVAGKLLKQESYKKILTQTVIEIDLSMLSPGVYFMKLQSEKGVDQKKIILAK